MPPPQRTKAAPKSAQCRVGDEFPRPHPPHTQPVHSRPRPHAPKNGRSGLGERPTLDAPHLGKRHPPGAPSCRPRSAPSQFARARAVGLVTGPHARTPPNHTQWVVGPGRTPQRTGGRAWGSARPRTPQTQARGAPPCAIVPFPQRAKPARKSARCGVCEGSPPPHPPHPQPVGVGPWPHAPKDGRSGVGERPIPDAPHPGKRRPPRVPFCRPHSAQSQLARARTVGLVTGPHARTPRTHSQWVVCPGRTPQGPAQKGAHNPKPGRWGTGPGPPPAPSKADSARDRGRTRGGAQTAWNSPTRAQHRNQARCARHTDPGWGEGRGRCESASARTRKGHAGNTRRATGTSPLNAQTVWNGVPASEDKGHPDRTARHTQRGKRGARRGKCGRHKTRHWPQPP